MKKIASIMAAVSLLGFFCSFTQSVKASDAYMEDWECPCKKKKKNVEGTVPSPTPAPAPTSN